VPFAIGDTKIPAELLLRRRSAPQTKVEEIAIKASVDCGGISWIATQFLGRVCFGGN
jgi:hypothetical protein